MYRNLARLREAHGSKHFLFLPKTFILPAELDQLKTDMTENPGKKWIVKPASSSQGKGIFITQDCNEIPQKEQLVASEYLWKPLLIDGTKFDLRVYVALTSINPLRIYIYEDGLARFATGKYDDKTNTKQARFTHLTNYSLNKNSTNFVENTNAVQDDHGHKWSHAALRKRLRKMGIDDVLLWKKMEDLIIKTVISVEHIINNANEMYCPFPRTNCFELFGFDVLID